ncbi:HAD-IA family hydrolase [Candidatus Woesearchaeota archaeon]|nr:HAD-IA family hydrolase [Candidatus Woesearchaeota archaeon]
MLKAIIFDVNGIFIESEKLSYRLQKDYGVSSQEVLSTLKEIMPKVRQLNAPSCATLFEPHLKKWKTGLTGKEFLDYWFSGEHLVSEMVKYGEKLRDEGLKVFLLSNNFKERTDYYLLKFPELFAMTDKAYFSHETGFTKPDKQAYLHILSEWNLNPQEVAYFDDSKENVQAAEELGIHAEKWEGIAPAKKSIEKLLR